MARRWLSGIGVLALLLAALLAGRRWWSPNATPVLAATARFGAFESWVSTNGVIEPSDPRVIRAVVPTYVLRVSVVEGQPVARDAVLLTLDVAAQRAELLRAREELLKAEGQLRLDRDGGASDERARIESDLRNADTDVAHLRREHDALERLVLKEAATRTDLDQAVVALARAETNRETALARQQALDRQATENIRIRELSVERLRAVVRRLESESAETVRAPVDGTVYSMPARAGTIVQPGDALAAVGDLKAMQVRAFVDEAELASIRTGQAVQVSWSAVPGRVWHATVDRLPGAIVSKGDRRVGEVICHVENEDGRLMPNLDVDVRVLVESRARTLLLPREAVRSDSAGYYLFVIQDGVASRRPVTIEARSPTSYAILGGVNEGDRIAIPEDGDLRDGLPVRTISELP